MSATVGSTAEFTFNNTITYDVTTVVTTNFTSNYVRPFTDAAIVVTASIIFVFLIVGVIGNTLTLAVIVSYRVLHSNVFMRFILSLCVSDLISALISWLFLYRRTWGFDNWAPLPDIFCKFYWSADLMTSYVTALHILSFAILRLISIKYPIIYNELKMKHANIWIGCIWATCFVCGFIPSMFIFGSAIPDRSSNNQNARWPACTILLERHSEYKIFQNVTFPTFIYAPTFGVVLVCIYIIVIVKIREKTTLTTQEKKKKKEKQAVLQLVLIIVAFLIGYIPFTAYEFWSIQDYPNEPYYDCVDYWFGMTEYLFLRFSECLNPLFYNLGSAKMRKHTKKFLVNKLPCITCGDEKDATSATNTSANATAAFGV